MIKPDSSRLLFIEPATGGTPEPVVDDYVRRMVFAYRNGEHAPGGQRWRGWHTCQCGARSSNFDTKVCPVSSTGDDCYLTNSLCIHYLLWHRPEVPDEELAKVRRLPLPSPSQPLRIILPGESQAPPMARGRWAVKSAVPL